MLFYCALRIESTIFQVVSRQRTTLERQRATDERMLHMEFLLDKRGEGYQREQVDAYIRELRQTYQQMYEAYQTAHREYTALEKRYGELQQKYQALEAQAQKQQAQMAGMQYPGYQPYPMPTPPCGAAAPYGMPYPMPAGTPGAMPGTMPAMPGGYYY